MFIQPLFLVDLKTPKKILKLTDFYFSISGRKSELLNELHQLVKGNVGKIIFAHDTVRVIECLVAQGDENIRYGNTGCEDFKEGIQN